MKPTGLGPLRSMLAHFGHLLENSGKISTATRGLDVGPMNQLSLTWSGLLRPVYWVDSLFKHDKE